MDSDEELDCAAKLCEDSAKPLLRLRVDTPDADDVTFSKYSRHVLALFAAFCSGSGMNQEESEQYVLSLSPGSVFQAAALQSRSKPPTLFDAIEEAHGVDRVETTTVTVEEEGDETMEDKKWELDSARNEVPAIAGESAPAEVEEKDEEEEEEDEEEIGVRRDVKEAAGEGEREQEREEEEEKEAVAPIPSLVVTEKEAEVEPTFAAAPFAEKEKSDAVAVEAVSVVEPEPRVPVVDEETTSISSEEDEESDVAAEIITEANAVAGVNDGEKTAASARPAAGSINHSHAHSSVPTSSFEEIELSTESQNEVSGLVFPPVCPATAKADSTVRSVESSGEARQTAGESVTITSSEEESVTSTGSSTSEVKRSLTPQAARLRSVVNVAAALQPQEGVEERVEEKTTGSIEGQVNLAEASEVVSSVETTEAQGELHTSGVAEEERGEPASTSARYEGEEEERHERGAAVDAVPVSGSPAVQPVLPQREREKEEARSGAEADRVPNIGARDVEEEEEGEDVSDNESTAVPPTIISVESFEVFDDQLLNHLSRVTSSTMDLGYDVLERQGFKDRVLNERVMEYCHRNVREAAAFLRRMRSLHDQIEQLYDMGVEDSFEAAKALITAGGDLDRAVQILF
uniref:UBA domain-containing protein n=1 Tax=Palpitomonas bilix TaxID=652834 RepID=A0A7S3LX70_9EUKA